MKKINVLTFIPTFGRPEISEICFVALKRSYNLAPDCLEFQTLIIASCQKGAKQAKNHGFDAVIVENKPIGRKFNKGLEHAFNYFDFDYFFQLNSDNILSLDFWEYFAPMIEAKRPFFGVSKLAFFDVATSLAVSWLYADGCGIRFIRKDILRDAAFCIDAIARRSMSGHHGLNIGAGQKVVLPLCRFKENNFIHIGAGQFVQLWHPEKNSGLDINSAWQIYKARPDVFPISFPLNAPILVVDLKTEENIHAFSEFQKDGESIEVSELVKMFPELEEIKKPAG